MSDNVSETDDAAWPVTPYPVQNTPRYWQVYPGQGASAWELFKGQSVVAIEWSGTGDIRAVQPNSVEDVKAWVDTLDAMKGRRTFYVARQFWDFYHEMRPGDLVCAYARGQALGWGEVTGDYYFAEDDFGNPHRRSVRWESTTPIPASALPAPVKDKLQQRRTITPLTETDFAAIQSVAIPESESASFDRTSEESAREVIERLLPEDNARRDCMALLADSIRIAHGLGPSAWGVTLFQDAVRLNVGRVSALPVFPNQLYTSVDTSVLGEEAKRELGNALESWERFGSSVPAEVASVNIAPANLRDTLPIVRDAHHQLLRLAARSVTQTPYWGTHSGGVILYLRDYLGQPDIPQPAYYIEEGRQPMPVATLLDQALSRQGLHFTPWQVATFYTGLQTKGFVILSGISGTGKTKLAQHFAEMLPQPAGVPRVDSGTAIAITVYPYMLKDQNFVIPVRAAKRFQPITKNRSRDVTVVFDGREQVCKVARSVSGSSDFVSLYLRGAAKEWFSSTFSVGDTFVLDLETDEEGVLTKLFLDRPQTVGATEGDNLLFVPVRPDWRDSKSLLGYYNPLTDRYEWTDFLRFLRLAEQSYRHGDGLAWFVILDEMNLAHVEYYFADLLSVLESGRDADGWTREPLRFSVPEDAELTGEIPPPALKLPPNLYVVGTVNVDETTHAFSPKVLDRAFTIELTDVDFSGYPPKPGDGPASDDAARRALLDAFTRGGRFERVEKAAIAEYVGTNPAVRDRFQTLNVLLRPHGLHFGYRVFDEVVTFLAIAGENGMFVGLGGQVAALDAAVLMKVLPKFHGSRARLEPPLCALLAWCADPDAPDTVGIATALDAAEVGDGAAPVLDTSGYACPRTAARALRTLRTLRTDGFAAFG
jgi:energy-coupling factor transporter ATP-binding protein EcfA2